MRVFISKNGQELGPYTVDQIHAQISAGTIEATDWARCEGLADWGPLNHIPAFAAWNSPHPSPQKRPVFVWIICLLIFIGTPFEIFQKLSVICFFATTSVRTGESIALPNAFSENGDFIITIWVALLGVLLYLIGALYLFCLLRKPALSFFIGAFIFQLLADGIINSSRVSSPGWPADFWASAAVELAIRLVIIWYTWKLIKEGVLR